MRTTISVDDAQYEPGRNWCWFTLQKEGMVVTFRLHFDDNVCWALFRALDTSSIHALEGSASTFRFGSGEKRGPIARGAELLNARVGPFGDVDLFLAQTSGGGLGHHGARFFVAGTEGAPGTLAEVAK